MVRIPRNRWEDLGLGPGTLPGTLYIAGERSGAGAFALLSSDGLDVAAAGRAVRSLQQQDVGRHVLLIATDRTFARMALLVAGADGEVRSLVVDRSDVRASDADTLREMAAREGDGPAALALRHMRALDRSRVTRRFFEDFRERRSAVAAAWTGLPTRAKADRGQLALLFLCRLMFLYFLQTRGHLAGDERFLPRLVQHWRARPGSGSFYRALAVPLFFGALNKRPERRTGRAQALGALPYLNGGLFEYHAVERRHSRLDLPDEAVYDVFDGLLEHYRFTTRESSAGGDAGIDPEMLGRVFEGVMSGSRRADTGTFYTPASAVDAIVRDSVEAWLAPKLTRESAAAALADIRVLDPACGSGAFLLGALATVSEIRAAGEGRTLAEVRNDVVGRALHGVDVEGDAALLCALRLWLALADESASGGVQPLPNLDRRIRQGDALLDPIDLAAAESGDARSAAMDTHVRHAIRALEPLAQRYLLAEPERRQKLRSALAHCERTVARAWIESLRSRATRRIRELEAVATGQDLFGGPGPGAREAAAGLPSAERHRAELELLRARLRDDRAVPFFSFPVHFAETGSHGFDLILSNPPWVRAHRWPTSVRGLIRRRYEFGRSSGWRFGSQLAGAPAAAGAQVDLALLFLERAIALLAPGGVIGMLLPAKMLRSLFAGPARKRLLHDPQLLRIRDFSLDQHAVFSADAFATSIVARRSTEPGEAAAMAECVAVTMLRRGVPALEFQVPRSDLPLFPEDAASPWLLAPDAARAAFRRMQRAGAPLGCTSNLRVRRGVFTGANHVLIVKSASPGIGGLASIRALGFDDADDDAGPSADYEAVVEASALRPLVRGADVDAWSFRSRAFVVWNHGADGRPQPPPRRLARYLARHERALSARAGGGGAFPIGALFRVTADTLAPKVAWHDLSDTLRAVALPDRVRSGLGEDGPLVPLNTVYFIPVPAPERALLLAAYFNSLTVRTFARAIAERAKDARFRFFAWTLASVPLPSDWEQGANAAPLLRLSRQAHEDGGLDDADAARLDDLIARRYRLRDSERDGMRAFDRWLRGLP